MVFTLLPATGEDFVDREELVQEIVSTLSNKKLRMGFALYGKRRIGKTSIFKEVIRRLNKKRDIVPVYFSLWNLMEGTVEEFVKKLLITVLEAYKDKINFKFKVKNLLKASLEIIKDLIKDIKIGLKLKEDIEILLTFSRKEVKDYTYLMEKLLNFTERLAEETKTRCVLFLDEFPSIIDLKADKEKIGEGIIKNIRTWYEDSKNVIFCVSGSIRKTMEITTFSPVSPFYRQLIIREITPLSKEYVDQLVLKNIKDKNVSAEALQEIWDFCQGIPFYVQILGRALERMKKIDQLAVKKAVEEFLTNEGEVIFREAFEKLSSKEKKIVITIAQSKVYSISELSKKINEDINITGRFLSYLEEKGVLGKTFKGTYQFEDPVFERWLGMK